MSVDPNSVPSPPSSEGGILPRPRMRVATEEQFKKDKNYRRYAASVERALSLFDTALQEWADYISFLSRLLKALQGRPQNLPIVPSKAIVAKRLAQCLNPSLPSGVHQKALEVYSYIFSLLKPEALAQDLSLYLPGIAPTLTFASLSVRPLFLSLIETYLVNLDSSALRPALKSIVLALLPGLEEETSDDFETALRIMNKFRHGTGKSNTSLSDQDVDSDSQYFWQCLFLASITNPSRRLGVLAYFNRHLPKLGVDDPRSVMGLDDAPAKLEKLPGTIQFLISPEPGLLIRCFASGLADEQLLVQRNFLDLLVTHLPLHSPVLQKHITPDDFEKLVTAAAGVVTRRDMSLNRRLWAWFLGPETSAEEKGTAGSGENNSTDHDAPDSFKFQYFGQFGLKPLVQSMKNMISRGTLIPQERARPFRIALSLMDRWEVGGLVVPELFLALLDNVKHYEEQVTSKGQFDEVFRSASAFFDGVESSLIFSELLGLLDPDRASSNARMDSSIGNLQLAGFILSNFNVREEEMLLVHVPLLTLALLIKMGALASQEEATNGASQDRLGSIEMASKLAHQLIDLLPERAFLRRFRSDSADALAYISQKPSKNGELLLNKIREFYTQSKDSLDLPPLPFPPKAIAELILREALQLVLSALESDDRSILKERSSLLISLLKKAPKSRVLGDGRLFQSMSRRLSSEQETVQSFPIISSIASLTTTLYSTHIAGLYINYEQICELTPVLVPKLWEFLSPLSPKFHVEAVRSLWNLHYVSWHDHLVEASITSLMIRPGAFGSSHLTTVDNVERFFVLWNHSHQGNFDVPQFRVLGDQGSTGKFSKEDRSAYQSSLLDRPLFIVLDLLTQPSNEGSQVVREWLQDLSSVYKIFEMIASKLDGVTSPNLGEADSGDNPRAISPDNVKECTYLFRAVSNILFALSHAGWTALNSHSVEVLEKNQDSSADGPRESISLQSAIMHYALRALHKPGPNESASGADEASLQQTVLSVVRQLLSGPGGEQLLDLNLDVFLIDRLCSALDENNSALQASIIDTLLPALKSQFSHRIPETPPPVPKHKRAGSRETLASISQLSLNALNSDKTEKEQPAAFVQPPQQLLDCLLKGISSSNSHAVVEKWVQLLCECLPFYSGAIFQILLMLVECFCREIKSSYHQLQLVFRQTEERSQGRPEHVTVALLTGLENCIGRAHERLAYEEAALSSGKSPDPGQGFFGNMVSGVFTTEGSQGRSTAANNRLTVLLCFQDAVRLCFSIWAWGSAGRSGHSQDTESLASFQYTSLRMRNRSRRILEHLFAAEALECLETLIELWCSSAKPESSTSIFNLLHTLDGSRPKITVPALFNSIYSRTNPAALDPRRKSAMTSSLTEGDLVAFLVTYARSLDDDVLDEIWADCTTFLRDVLANPFPHRQILPRLMEFAAIIGEKMENTNFSEDRRIRKELGDLLLRLLTAIFTSKPMGLSHDPTMPLRAEKPQADQDQSSQQQMGPDDVLSILVTSMPAFITTLGESDRIVSAMSNISGNIISPLLRSRLFPQSVNHSALNILQQMTKVPSASKLWKKDVGDAFNDHRFFGTHLDLVRHDWLGLLRQWVLVDKDRLPELLTRLTPPTSAGIMFGVGASAARLEADRKAQLNLRRIALLVLAADDDHFAAELSNLQQKLEDLLTATHVSSPSSATRAEIYMVLRAVVLKTSTVHLAPFWPVINTELQEAVSSIMPNEQSETYNPHSLLQGCKLLDILLLIAPDDFQLQEWLFVTDTTDAVYPPDRWEPVALAHEVSHSFGSGKMAPTFHLNDGSTVAPPGYKRPWLMSDYIRDTAKDEIIDRILRPFFDRLSIHAFESTYGMGVPDIRACRDDLLADIFDEGTMAN